MNVIDMKRLRRIIYDYHCLGCQPCIAMKKELMPKGKKRQYFSLGKSVNNHLTVIVSTMGSNLPCILHLNVRLFVISAIGFPFI